MLNLTNENFRKFTNLLIIFKIGVQLLKRVWLKRYTRKTWGFHQRVTFGTDLPTLMECFNHSTQKQTLAYLCVQPDEIRNVYENEL